MAIANDTQQATIATLLDHTRESFESGSQCAHVCGVVSTALSPGHPARVKRSFPPFDAEREGRDVDAAGSQLSKSLLRGMIEGSLSVLECTTEGRAI